MGVIGPEEYDFIVKNCSYSNEELREMLKEKFNVDITVDGVTYHLKKARAKAEAATRCADAHISKKVSERVNERVLDFMGMMEGEIEKLYRTLQNECDSLKIRSELDKDGEDTGRMNIKDYVAVERVFQESLKNYVALRPQIQTVKVEGLGSFGAEEQFLQSLSDDELLALKAIAKKREKFEEDEVEVEP